jgi:hypothetical protein
MECDIAGMYTTGPLSSYRIAYRGLLKTRILDAYEGRMGVLVDDNGNLSDAFKVSEQEDSRFLTAYKAAADACYFAGEKPDYSCVRVCRRTNRT